MTSSFTAGPACAATVFVAIRSELVQLGLREVLRGLEGVELVGTATDPRQAALVLAKVHSNVLLVDDEHFAELDTRLMGRTRVFLLSAHHHMALSRDACDRLCGMVGIYAPREELIARLRTVVHCSLQHPDGAWCMACPLRNSLVRPPLPLSEREREVFEHIGCGERPAEIAQQFGLSVKTVETHRENIKRKLGLRSAVELTDAAMRWCRGEDVAPDSRACRR